MSPGSTRSSRPLFSSAAPRLLGAISVALFLVLATSASAQQSNDTTGAANGTAAGTSSGGSGGGFGFDSNKNDPIEISAENGIEWKRDARTYTARGNAIAKQGDTQITADTLIAYLDEQNNLARWEATGNVKIQTNQSTSYGDHADYQEASRLLVLTGRNLKVVTDKQTITARDQIEYWRDKKVVVAKGAVVMVQPDKHTTVHSDEATSYFRDKVDDPSTPENEAANGGSELYQVEAEGHVRVDRNEQTGYSNHLSYNPKTEIAVLTGNVKVYSKDNTYTGGRAELDLKNDVSRLLPAQGQRVFTVIQPKKSNNDNSGNNSGGGTQLVPPPVTQ